MQVELSLRTRGIELAGSMMWGPYLQDVAHGRHPPGQLPAASTALAVHVINAALDQSIQFATRQ